MIIQGYSSLDHENRQRLLLLLAKEYDLNRAQVRELIKQYLGLEVPSGELRIDMLLYSNFFLLLIFVRLSWCGSLCRFR